MSPVGFVSVIDFLVSPALHTAHYSVGFLKILLFFFFPKYFQIPGFGSQWDCSESSPCQKPSRPWTGRSPPQSMLPVSIQDKK